MKINRSSNVHLEEPTVNNEACVWTEDEEGIWFACDDPQGGRNAFNFESGGPDENGFNFCPYCGRKLAAVYA